MSRRRRPKMPSFYGKNIAQNAQRKFFERKRRERAVEKPGASNHAGHMDIELDRSAD